MDNLIAQNKRVKHKKSKSSTGRAGDVYIMTPTTISPLRQKIIPFPVKQVSFEIPKLTSSSKTVEKLLKAKFHTSKGDKILKSYYGLYYPNIGSRLMIDSILLVDMEETRSGSIMEIRVRFNWLSC